MSARTERELREKWQEDATSQRARAEEASAAVGRAYERMKEFRVPTLAVALMLKNRLDATRIVEGSHVLQVIEDYDHVKRLRALLDPVTDDELAAATELWERLAE